MEFLEGEQQQESHHKTEKTHGFRQGESQNVVGKKLLFEGGVASITDDQASENWTNSGSWSGDSDGGSSGTDELGGAVNVVPAAGGGQSAAGNGSLKMKRYASFYRN